MCNAWKNDIAVSTKYCPVDLIFVMDESGTVKPEHFDEMKEFVMKVATGLKAQIDNGNTRVGAVTYSNHVDETINLNNQSSFTALEKHIQELTYSGGGTLTDKALNHVRTQMLTPAAGDRSDVRNVVVVMTDGASTLPEDTLVCTLWTLVKKLSQFRNYLQRIFIVMGVLYKNLHISDLQPTDSCSYFFAL